MIQIKRFSIFTYTLIYCCITISSVNGQSSKKANNSLPPDYSVYGHTVYVDKLRAGNHDPDGINEYYFSLTIFAVSNTESEKKKNLENREHLKETVGTFADVKLTSLSQLEIDPKSAQKFTFAIDGDLIRTSVAKAMTRFGVLEKEILIYFQIELHEKSTKYYFLNEDVVLGTVRYFPLSEDKDLPSLRPKGDLTIKDNNGLVVKINVEYESPKTAKK